MKYVIKNSKVRICGRAAVVERENTWDSWSNDVITKIDEYQNRILAFESVMNWYAFLLREQLCCRDCCPSNCAILFGRVPTCSDEVKTKMNCGDDQRHPFEKIEEDDHTIYKAQLKRDENS